jgi:ribosomal protein S19
MPAIIKTKARILTKLVSGVGLRGFLNLWKVNGRQWVGLRVRELMVGCMLMFNRDSNWYIFD